MLTTLRPCLCSPGAKTPCGQTVEHIPQLIHNPTLKVRVLRVLTATKPVVALDEQLLALAFDGAGAQQPLFDPQQLAISTPYATQP